MKNLNEVTCCENEFLKGVDSCDVLELTELGKKVLGENEIIKSVIAGIKKYIELPDFEQDDFVDYDASEEERDMLLNAYGEYIDEVMACEVRIIDTDMCDIITNDLKVDMDVYNEPFWNEVLWSVIITFLEDQTGVGFIYGDGQLEPVIDCKSCDGRFGSQS